MCTFGVLVAALLVAAASPLRLSDSLVVDAPATCTIQHHEGPDYVLDVLRLKDVPGTELTFYDGMYPSRRAPRVGARAGGHFRLGNLSGTWLYWEKQLVGGATLFEAELLLGTFLVTLSSPTDDGRSRLLAIANSLRVESMKRQRFDEDPPITKGGASRRTTSCS